MFGLIFQFLISNATLKDFSLPPNSNGPWKEGYVVNNVEGYVVGKSPQVIDFTTATQQHRIWISPRWNNEVFERSGVHKVFFLILLLIVVGEFFRLVESK